MLSTTRATRTKAQYHEAASATAFEVLLKNIGPFLGLKAITFRHQRERERERNERGGDMDMGEKSAWKLSFL